jgi:hypothetical protein
MSNVGMLNCHQIRGMPVFLLTCRLKGPDTFPTPSIEYAHGQMFTVLTGCLVPCCLGSEFIKNRMRLLGLFIENLIQVRPTLPTLSKPMHSPL